MVKTISRNETILDAGGGISVSAVLTLQETQAATTGVILPHGLANDLHHLLLVEFGEVLAASGYAALRFNFPYREEGRETPDPPEILIATCRAAALHLKGRTGLPVARVIAAGKSLGGRMAAQAVAEGLLEVDALVFLGYPLHPPGRTDLLRDAPLYRITKIPLLFFVGTHDPFCDLNVLQNVLVRLKSPWQLEIVPDSEHSFLPSSGDPEETVVRYRQMARRTVEWLAALCGS